MSSPTDTVSAHGLTVPALGFGTWELTPDVARDRVLDALELGYRHIDTAAMYENETAIGNAIHDSRIDRDQVHVTTKIWIDDAAHDDLLKAAEASLRRLDLDWVDLLLIHWPTDVAPIEETVAALAEVQERGQTRAIGVSNYTADQIHRAAKVAPIVTNQVEFHPFLSQWAVREACQEHDMFLTAYSPLAHGQVIDAPILSEIAAEVERGPAEVALRWLLDHGDIAALPRSSNRDHIAENLGVDFVLTESQRIRIDELPKDLRQINPPFAPVWDAA